MNEQPLVEHKPPRLSRTINEFLVLPNETNHHGTLFGGELMKAIDSVAAITASKHCRKPVVTASTDSVDFLSPVKLGNSVLLEGSVTWTHRSSMEILVKIITEELLTGKRTVCATSFLTFVALGPDGKPIPVPKVLPESKEELYWFETAPARAELRKSRKDANKKLVNDLIVLDIKNGNT